MLSCILDVLLDSRAFGLESHGSRFSEGSLALSRHLAQFGGVEQLWMVRELIAD